MLLNILCNILKPSLDYLSSVDVTIIHLNLLFKVLLVLKQGYLNPFDVYHVILLNKRKESVIYA